MNNMIKEAKTRTLIMASIALGFCYGQGFVLFLWGLLVTWEAYLFKLVVIPLGMTEAIISGILIFVILGELKDRS